MLALYPCPFLPIAVCTFRKALAGAVLGSTGYGGLKWVYSDLRHGVGILWGAANRLRRSGQLPTPLPLPPYPVLYYPLPRSALPLPRYILDYLSTVCGQPLSNDQNNWNFR